MSENKKLTPEEVAEKLIKHAKENEKPVRALQDDELDSVAGGGGSYNVSDKCYFTPSGREKEWEGEIRLECCFSGGVCYIGGEAARTYCSCDGTNQCITHYHRIDSSRNLLPAGVGNHASKMPPSY